MIRRLIVYYLVGASVAFEKLPRYFFGLSFCERPRYNNLFLTFCQ